MRQILEEIRSAFFAVIVASSGMTASGSVYERSGDIGNNSPETWVTHVDDKASRTRPQSACGARSDGGAATVQD